MCLSILFVSFLYPWFTNRFFTFFIPVEYEFDQDPRDNLSSVSRSVVNRDRSPMDLLRVCVCAHGTRLVQPIRSQIVSTRGNLFQKKNNEPSKEKKNLPEEDEEGSNHLDDRFCSAVVDQLSFEPWCNICLSDRDTDADVGAVFRFSTCLQLRGAGAKVGSKKQIQASCDGSVRFQHVRSVLLLPVDCNTVTTNPLFPSTSSAPARIPRPKVNAHIDRRQVRRKNNKHINNIIQWVSHFRSLDVAPFQDVTHSTNNDCRNWR